MNCRNYGTNKMEATTMNANQSDQDKEYNQAKHQVGEAIDHAFGAGTAKSAEGRADQIIGYAEGQAGYAAGDQAVEFDGVKHAVRGSAERVEGRAEHDLAVTKTQIEKDVAALKAEMSNLKAEYSTATGEARAKVQSSMDTTKAKAQATQDRISAALEGAKQEADARIASLQQQAAQATGEVKARIQDEIAQVRYENKQFADGLNKALADNMTVLSR
jgi:hypothetical protein